jgi:hypothetical protein
MTSRADEVLEKLMGLVRADPRSMFDENNAVLPPELWPDEIASCITSFTSRDIWTPDRVLIGRAWTVKLSDKIRALELTLRESGLLNPNKLPPRDLDDLSDRELITRVEYCIVNGGRVDIATSWAVLSDEQIDKDFQKIVDTYDKLRPGVRLNSAPESPAEPRQRYLPPPTRLPPISRDKRIRRSPPCPRMSL